MKRKFDQDLGLNLRYDFGKMNSTLGSVVPLAMFGNWSVHSSRVMFCKSPVMFNVVFSLFSLRVDKSLRVPGLVSKKFRIIQLPSVKGLG